MTIRARMTILGIGILLAFAVLVGMKEYTAHVYASGQAAMDKTADEARRLGSARTDLSEFRGRASRVNLIAMDKIVMGLLKVDRGGIQQELDIEIDATIKYLDKTSKDMTDSDKRQLSDWKTRLRELQRKCNEELDEALSAADRDRVAKLDDEIDELVSTIQQQAESIEKRLINEAEAASKVFYETREKAIASGKNTRLAFWVIVVLALISTGSLVYLNAIRVIKPIHEGLAFAEALEIGDLSIRVKSQSSDELGQLNAALNKAADSLQHKADLARQIADGNLTGTVDLSSDKDALGLALKEMSEQLSQMVAEIRSNADTLTLGAGNIADSSQNLSQQTTGTGSLNRRNQQHTCPGCQSIQIQRRQCIAGAITHQRSARSGTVRQ
jgi:methyl-accepting chemotaxis protein